MKDKTIFFIFGIGLLLIGTVMVKLLFEANKTNTIEYIGVCRDINKPYLGIIEHERYVEVFCYDNFKRDTHKVAVLKNGTV